MTYLEILNLAETALFAQKNRQMVFIKNGSKILAQARLKKIDAQLEELGQMILAEEKRLLNN